MAEAIRFVPLTALRQAAQTPFHAGPLPERAEDSLARPLYDVRISVTDRCNFRCVYCMPREQYEGHRFLPRRELLTFEEIERVAQLLVRLGVRKIRITGGEPLLRHDLPELIARLAQLPVELTLTTNGVLLPKYAAALKAAGLHRVTVSLDALDEAVFRRIADVPATVQQVLAGIDAAANAGLAPVKVNMVVRRGMNDDQIEAMAAHFRGTGHILRFIEFMDVGTTNGWRMLDVVPAKEILQRLALRWPLEPVEPAYFGEVAERWRYRDGAGEIGVIASVTQPFCRSCTRLRLSTDGKLFTCLFAAEGFDIRALLRGGAEDETLLRTIVGVWQQRRDRYSEIRTEETAKQRKAEMSYLGG